MGSRHADPHEQHVQVVKDAMWWSETASFEARARDSFVVPGGVEHQASALEAFVVLDVFTSLEECRPT